LRAGDVGKIEINQMTSLVPGTKLYQELSKGAKGAWHQSLPFAKNKNMLYL